MADFVHLHVHSLYSLLQGAIRLKDLMERVKKGGMDTVAITDTSNLFGAVDFVKKAKAAGVKPILGTEAVVSTGDPNVPDAHVVLLAKNEGGYKNLSWLLSKAYLEYTGEDGRPRIPKKVLAGRTEGLFALSACLKGEPSAHFIRGNPDAAREAAVSWRDMFAPGHYHLEIQSNAYPDTRRVNDFYKELSRDLRIPLVATNDCHYLERKDARAHEVLMAIQAQVGVDELRRGRPAGDGQYVRSAEEMLELFEDVPDAVYRSAEIAAECSVDLHLSENTYLPNFEVPDGFDQPGWLREASRRGLERRFKELAGGPELDRDGYLARLDLELDVIIDMKFPGYFLIVQDFINWAKDHGVPVGPGRGSGAGSLVAYALRITDIDPIQHGLLFERFLNPERVSMPDFDVDFCQTRRDRVIRYVAEKYGRDQVGQIATFQALKPRSVVRDVVRVMGLPFKEGDLLAKLIPPALDITLPRALAEEPRLRELYEDRSRPEYKEILDIATALEGLNRQAGMHAAGVVIGDKPLWEYVPLLRGNDGEIVTQFAKDEVEEAGLVKFDFLGLKTLTVIDHAVSLINRDRPPAEPLVIDALPLDDPEVYKLISRGDTTGVFQLESSGFKELLKKLKPDRFSDIVAAVALYRPGPLQSGMVDDYIARKHGRQEVRYDHPALEPILKETNGVIVYQEQVMEISRVLAGYSLGRADILRRAMGKKKAEVMAKERAGFLEGAEKTGIEAKLAGDIFDLMEKFAAYGFNKCLVGSTRIVEADTGEQTTLEALLHDRRPFRIHALGEDGTLRPRAVTDVVWNGRKPVFELRTALGRRIVATDNHPFRTYGAWTELGRLAPGDLIAACVGDPAASDLVWDRIVAIEARGTEDTYDLTVEVDHNFVAEGLVVHNSHSAAYGLITYQTAWLKAHYPVELMTALLTSEQNSTDKIVAHIDEVRRLMGITVLPPDVNESALAFDPAAPVEAGRKKRIRFGLGAVKGVGESAIEAIMEARTGKDGGPFRGLFDFCERVDTRKVNKKTAEVLVKSGCFDFVGVPRWRLIQSVERALDRGSRVQRDKAMGQSDLFGGGGKRQAAAWAVERPDLYEQPGVEETPWTERQLLAFEKEAIGFYISGHPLDRYAEDIPRLASRIESVREAGNFQDVSLAGVITLYKEWPLKNGNGRMAKITLEDLSGSAECLCFSAEFAEYEALLKSDEPLLLEGKTRVDAGDEEEERTVTVRVTKVQRLADVRAANSTAVTVTIGPDALTAERATRLEALLKAHPGDCRAYLKVREAGRWEAVIRVKGAKVYPSDELLSALDYLFGGRVSAVL